MPNRPDPEGGPPRLTVSQAIRLPSLVNVTLALVFAALAAGGAAAFTLTRPAIYQSQTTILLDHPDVARVANVNPILRLNALRKTYAALVRTQEIAGPVAADLGITKAEVAAEVNIVITADSLVMYPTARTRGRKESQILVERLSTELINYVKRQQDAAGIAADDRVTLVVVDHATVGFKVSPLGQDAIAAAALAGGVGMVLAYVLLQIITAPRRVERAHTLTP